MSPRVYMMIDKRFILISSFDSSVFMKSHFFNHILFEAKTNQKKIMIQENPNEKWSLKEILQTDVISEGKEKLIIYKK